MAKKDAVIKDKKKPIFTRERFLKILYKVTKPLPKPKPPKEEKSKGNDD
jgi:hypothetical protein